MKGLMLLANEFEDIEGLGTLDLIRRAKIEIDTCSITGHKEVVTQSKVVILADKLVEDIKLDEYSFLIIPGGAAIMKTHYYSEVTELIVNDFAKRNCLIGAICAAPSVLGKAGLLNNLEFTCFPSFEKLIEGGIHMPDKKVCVEGNIITSKACGTTFDFAYEIIKKLKSETIAKHIIDSVFYKID